MSKNAFAGILLLVLLVTPVKSQIGEIGAPAFTDTPTLFGYQGYNGPSLWAKLSSANKLCEEGKEQSPINVPMKEFRQRVLPADFVLPRSTKFNVTRTMYSIDMKPLPPRRRKIGMTVNGTWYKLINIHIHTPSEHRVGNKHYPGEVHFVHKSDDGKLAVIGIFLQESRRDNPIWTKILKNTPKTMQENPITVDKLFKTSDVLDAACEGTFNYGGSLTTTPCTEGVQWFVTSVPMNISYRQMRQVVKIIGFTARPVMANHNVAATLGFPTTGISE